jgi:hypothetical protein
MSLMLLCRFIFKKLSPHCLSSFVSQLAAFDFCIKKYVLVVLWWIELRYSGDCCNLTKGCTHTVMVDWIICPTE